MTAVEFNKQGYYNYFMPMLRTEGVLRKELPMPCPVRRCLGTLVVEKSHVQDGTGDTAVTTRCSANRRHRYFIVEAVGTPIRLTDDTRWEKKTT